MIDAFSHLLKTVLAPTPAHIEAASALSLPASFHWQAG